MSFLYKCDICGGGPLEGNISSWNRPFVKRLSSETGKSVYLSLEVMMAVNEGWNGGHICDTCIAAALHELIERKGGPRAKTAEFHQ